jgi:ligand-binding sensor domain-containing protein/signal transduction histidine kinase
MIVSNRLLRGVWLVALGAGLGRTVLSAPGTNFTVRHYEMEQGLPSSAVLAVTQTRDGYLWLGTLNGLVRFDGVGRRTSGVTGVQFPVFDEGNTPGLTSSVIVKLFEDSRGNLWIGTEIGEVLVARDGKIDKAVFGGGGTREGRVKAICEDRQGRVWLYTADGQLFYSEPGTTKLIQLNTVPRQPSVSRAVLMDETGVLWLGTEYVTRVSQDLGRSGWGSTFAAQCLVASRRGGFWLVGPSGIFRFRGGKYVKFADCPWNTATRPVNAACEDANGNLVVGTGGEGVFWFDEKGRYAQLSTGSGLSHGTVLSMCMDREGDLWVGTDGGGLNCVKQPVFEVMEESRELSIRSVCQDATNGLWLGSFGYGVLHWNRGVFTTNNPALATTNSFDQGVTSVLVDSAHHVWAGTYGGGLFQFERGGFKPAPNTEILRARGEISVLFEDRSKKLWVGTKAGLACLTDQGWKMQTGSNGPAAAVVRAITEDGEGNLWVGTEGGGIGKFSAGKWSWFKKGDGLPGDNVYSLYADPEGVIWAGTFSGLARFGAGKWTSYAGHPGLANRIIGYVVEDGRGDLWMGSNVGLMRASKKALNDVAAGRATDVALRSYDNSDGLPTGECQRGSQPGACRESNGKMWFPTIHGLVSVHPESVRPNTNAPPVIIEAVRIDGQIQWNNTLRALLPRSITIPPRKESLEIDFTSLNLSAPEKGLFRYRLEPHERITNEVPATTRTVRYPKLPPGEYSFHVTACNEDGVWNHTGASLSVTVLPPFWRTWWFLGGLTLALLGLVVGTVHYVSTQKLQRQLAVLKQQEALEHERARIARDLHDQLGANLTQVTLLGEMAEADKNLPEEVEAHAQQICQTARDTTHALDEIVWTVNPSNDTLDGLVNYICKYAQDYLAIAGLKYRLEVPPELPNTPISPELRHNVFLVVKESVNNVVKHAQASSAWLRLQLQPHQFAIEVEDDGRGLKAEDRDKGRSGLGNMRKRMEDIGGSFEIRPREGGGTQVRLVAPLNSDIG